MESAKKHCKSLKWEWTLDLISQSEKEMEELQAKVKKLEDQKKAQRLYNSCNF